MRPWAPAVCRLGSGRVLASAAASVASIRANQLGGAWMSVRPWDSAVLAPEASSSARQRCAPVMRGAHLCRAHQVGDRRGGGRGGGEAQGEHRAAHAWAAALQHAGQGARRVLEMRGRGFGPRGRRVQPVGVVVALQHLHGGGFVQGEEFRVGGGVDRDVAAAAQEAGDADALGDMFAQVPVIELRAAGLGDSIPDGHDGFASEHDALLQ
jgi:hypothetical protein